MFLGKIFGWDQMGTKASAIAYRPPRARTYILIGRNVCDMTTPITLAINDPIFGSRMAWTTLSQQNTNANDVKIITFVLLTNCLLWTYVVRQYSPLVVMLMLLFNR